MSRFKPGTIYGIAALAVLVGTGVVVHNRAGSSAKQPVQKKMPLVAVATVQVGPIARTIDITGTVEPENAVDIAPKVEQRIIWMPLREGDFVRKGQVIVRLEDAESSDQLSSALAEVSVAEARLRDVLSGSRPQEIKSAKANLAQAEANLKQAEGDLRHIKKLYGAQGIPEQQLQDAQNRYETAQANAESAAATLSDAETDLTRLKRMLKIGGVAQEDVDKAETRYQVTKSALASAESAKRSAQSNLNHVKELNVKVIPEQQIDNAEAKYASAKPAVEAARARLDLLTEGASGTQIAVVREQVGQARRKAETIRTQSEYCVINSPIDGVITKLHLNEGDMAQIRQPIMSISENARMIVKAAIPDKDSAKISAGRAAMVKIGGAQDEPLKLKVTRVYPSADPISRLVPIEIALPASSKIPQGSFARVSLVMERREEAVLAPVDAVVQKPGGKAVAFVIENDVAHARPVRTGIEAKGKVEIISGVNPGEKIAVRGQEMLRDGAEVRAKEQKTGPGDGKSGAHQGNKIGGSQ